MKSFVPRNCEFVSGSELIAGLGDAEEIWEDLRNSSFLSWGTAAHTLYPAQALLDELSEDNLSFGALKSRIARLPKQGETLVDLEH